MKKLNLSKIKKINFRQILSRLLNHIQLIAVTMSLVLIVGFGLFLYRDFYLTIIFAREIVLLESEVSEITINKDFLNSIEQRHKQKQSLIIRDWSGFNNVFYRSTTPRNDNPVIEDEISDEIVNEDTPEQEDPVDEVITPVTSF